jgi:hypothetical protein
MQLFLSVEMQFQLAFETRLCEEKTCTKKITPILAKMRNKLIFFDKQCHFLWSGCCQIEVNSEEVGMDTPSSNIEKLLVVVVRDGKEKKSICKDIQLSDDIQELVFAISSQVILSFIFEWIRLTVVSCP